MVRRSGPFASQDSLFLKKKNSPEPPPSPTQPEPAAAASEQPATPDPTEPAASPAALAIAAQPTAPAEHQEPTPTHPFASDDVPPRPQLASDQPVSATAASAPVALTQPVPAESEDADEPLWLRAAASEVGLGSPPSTPPRTLSRADKAEEEEDARASPRTDTRAGGRRRSGRRGSGNRRSAYKARAAHV